MDTLTTSQTASLLGVTPERVYQLAAEGKIVRVQNSRPSAFTADSVDWLLEERARKRARRLPRVPAEQQRVPPELLPTNAELLSTRQAAEILMVRLDRVQQMVKLGRLLAVQRLPGIRGSRLQIVRASLENLLRDPDYCLRRARWMPVGFLPKLGKPWKPPGVQEPIPPVDFSDTLRAAMQVTSRPFLSTAQVAAILGISPAGVRRLRKIGRLRGYRSFKGRYVDGALELWNPGVRNPRWFFKRNEVLELRSYPAYARAHRAHCLAMTPERRAMRQEKEILAFIETKPSPSTLLSPAEWRHELS